MTRDWMSGGPAENDAAESASARWRPDEGPGFADEHPFECVCGRCLAENYDPRVDGDRR